MFRRRIVGSIRRVALKYRRYLNSHSAEMWPMLIYSDAYFPFLPIYKDFLSRAQRGKCFAVASFSTPKSGRYLKSPRRKFNSHHAEKWPMLIYNERNSVWASKFEILSEPVHRRCKKATCVFRTPKMIAQCTLLGSSAGTLATFDASA